MTNYRGRPIEYAVHDRKADTYSLIDADGECVAELQAREFLSIPNRGNLEVRSGRYRSAGSTDQRGADRKSGQARRDDALNAFLYAARGSVHAYPRAGKSPGLSVPDIVKLQQMMMAGQIAAFHGVYDPVFDELRPALKRDGVIAGEIIGYRCWRIARGDPAALIGRLRSVYQTDVWNPGDVLQGREMGDWDQRGIHAWKDSGSKQYHDYIRGYLNRETDPFYFAINNGDTNHDRPAMVTGTVFLWGDVVEHERGWRAEFARVRSLDWLYPDAIMMGREQEALSNLRRLYGVQ